MLTPTATSKPKLASVCFASEFSEEPMQSWRAELAQLVKTYLEGAHRTASPVGKLTYKG